VLCDELRLISLFMFQIYFSLNSLILYDSSLFLTGWSASGLISGFLLLCSGNNAFGGGTGGYKIGSRNVFLGFMVGSPE
jgi:hypothetical protein